MQIGKGHIAVNVNHLARTLQEQEVWIVFFLRDQLTVDQITINPYSMQPTCEKCYGPLQQETMNTYVVQLQT